MHFYLLIKIAIGHYLHFKCIPTRLNLDGCYGHNIGWPTLVYVTVDSSWIDSDYDLGDNVGDALNINKK